MLKKVLVYPRGEIAVRIIRACRELRIGTVAVYSEADAESLHVRLADEAVRIGPAAAQDSYLKMQNVLSAALITGADAIHPGYGFLAEDASFADACAACGIKFVGPSPESIERMGDKARARALMKDAGVPVVPGSEGVLGDEQRALREAAQIGYPLMIKAAAGGGGRGIRVVHGEEGLSRELRTAEAEAKAAFGNGALYLEKYLEEPRHVEFQILADEQGNTLHCGERDCSLQRRHQKMVEEAPCVGLAPELRREMGQAAVAAARAAGYANAGTVEFLLDRQGRYYFLEMNTRIQVEHPVTEMVTGIDLVKAQLTIASGLPLDLRQEEIRASGHAIECRITAEDPERQFAPSAGEIRSLLIPGGIGVRVDTHVYAGYRVPPHYDSLLAKLICWGRDREEAIQRMTRALDEFVVDGIHTTIPFHRQIMTNAFFRRGEVYTNFIQRRLEA
ncbi:MAG: acetyl-CoA carboxylase biotin carboxylase subunit [Armatimonadetes bacterium]|nr:acetyl-CoA carboxylase biotin carboxylase subunit [Armatimonadota bacterium]